MKLFPLHLIPNDTTIDFMRHRRPVLALMLVLLVASIAIIGLKGFNYALEFTGGTMVPVSYTHLDVYKRQRHTRAAGGRVIAVGTTVLRALESALVDGVLQPFAGDTSIFIFPGYKIRSVDALMTNFHLPESTLLMLVSAFAGKDRILAAYAHAVRERYRFFSYGDAMLLWPQEGVFPA